MANYKSLFILGDDMKILSFSDVHARMPIVYKLLEKAKRADVLICAGDMSNFGSGLKSSIQMLNKSGKPILILHGNHESEEDIKELAQQFPRVINIHKKMVVIGDYVFFGYGGGGFSSIEEGMEKFAIQLRRKIPAGKKIVFITHAPPYNTDLDYLPWLEEHRGCKSTVKVIKMIKPHLVICGHLHETAGKSCHLGKTLLLNAGWNGKIVEL